jgi:hypothetical protein
MRFMMFMIPSGPAEAGVMPAPELVAEMTRFNQEMTDAGVMLSGEGLQPTSKGARVSFGGGRPRVQDGPFTEAKEVVGGYWIIEVGSREEAIDWATRCPAEDGDVIELRQIFELTDFPPEVQAAAQQRS